MAAVTESESFLPRVPAGDSAGQQQAEPSRNLNDPTLIFECYKIR